MSHQIRNIVLFVILIGYIFISSIVSWAGVEGFIGSFSMFSSFDELYSIREVQNILDSSSFKELLLSAAAGNGYVYGRFIYVTNSIICFIPYSIFGIDGLVFSMRMAQCMYLFAGFWLLTNYIVKNYTSQILALLVLLVFPVTLYFMGIPKPEPIQMLLLGLFFNFYKKYNWSWLFLGLAMGSKISISFSVLFLGLVEVLDVMKTKQFKAIWIKGIWAILGLIIALPGLFFAIFYPNFRHGLINIVATTKKPYDDQSITFWTWLHKWMTYFYELPVFISYLLMILILVASIWFIFKRQKKTPYVIFAYAALLPIMILTKRLWGHYLFLGSAMLLPMVFEFIDQQRFKRILKPLIFSLFFIQVFFHSKAVINASKELETKEEIAIKNSTLEKIDYIKSQGMQGQVGVDISLYFSYSWIKNDSILSISSDEFDKVQILIVPAEHRYKLNKDYQLIKTEKGISIYKKK